jgi:hypothetical protein
MKNLILSIAPDLDLSAVQPPISSMMPVFLAILPIIVLIPVYFIPSIVAFSRKQPNKASILILNIFLGWTFIGWVLALVWACKKIEK